MTAALSHRPRFGAMMTATWCAAVAVALAWQPARFFLPRFFPVDGDLPLFYPPVAVPVAVVAVLAPLVGLAWAVRWSRRRWVAAFVLMLCADIALGVYLATANVS